MNLDRYKPGISEVSANFTGGKILRQIFTTPVVQRRRHRRRRRRRTIQPLDRLSSIHIPTSGTLCTRHCSHDLSGRGSLEGCLRCFPLQWFSRKTSSTMKTDSKSTPNRRQLISDNNHRKKDRFIWLYFLVFPFYLFLFFFFLNIVFDFCVGVIEFRSSRGGKALG